MHNQQQSEFWSSSQRSYNSLNNSYGVKKVQSFYYKEYKPYEDQSSIHNSQKDRYLKKYSRYGEEENSISPHKSPKYQKFILPNNQNISIEAYNSSSLSQYQFTENQRQFSQKKLNYEINLFSNININEKKSNKLTQQEQQQFDFLQQKWKKQKEQKQLSQKSCLINDIYQISEIKRSKNIQLYEIKQDLIEQDLESIRGSSVRPLNYSFLSKKNQSFMMHSKLQNSKISQKQMAFTFEKRNSSKQSQKKGVYTSSFYASKYQQEKQRLDQSIQPILQQNSISVIQNINISHSNKPEVKQYDLQTQELINYLNKVVLITSLDKSDVSQKYLQKQKKVLQNQINKNRNNKFKDFNEKDVKTFKKKERLQTQINIKQNFMTNNNIQEYQFQIFEKNNKYSTKKQIINKNKKKQTKISKYIPQTYIKQKNDKFVQDNRAGKIKLLTCMTKDFSQKTQQFIKNLNKMKNDRFKTEQDK